MGRVYLIVLNLGQLECIVFVCQLIYSLVFSRIDCLSSVRGRLGQVDARMMTNKHKSESFTSGERERQLTCV